MKTNKNPWKIDWGEATEPLKQLRYFWNFNHKTTPAMTKQIHPLPQYNFEEEVLQPLAKYAKGMGYEMFLYKRELRLVQISKEKLRSYHFTPNEDSNSRESYKKLLNVLCGLFRTTPPALSMDTKSFLNEVNASGSMRALKLFLAQNKDDTIELCTYQQEQNSFKQLITSELIREALFANSKAEVVFSVLYHPSNGKITTRERTGIKLWKEGTKSCVVAEWPDCSTKETTDTYMQEFIKALDVSNTEDSIFVHLAPKYHEDIIKAIKQHLHNEYFTKDGFNLYNVLYLKNRLVPRGKEREFYHNLAMFFTDFCGGLHKSFMYSIAVDEDEFVFEVFKYDSEIGEDSLAYLEIKDEDFDVFDNKKTIRRKIIEAINDVGELMDITAPKVDKLNEMFKKYDLEFLTITKS